MKTNLILFVLVPGVLMTCMHASTNTEYQSETVISVGRHAIPSNSDDGDPSDAPLQSQVYSYDIGIRIGGTVYRTSYVSAFDDLPTVFIANHSVQVNLKRHILYVELPGERAVQMAIESRSGVKSVSRIARN
jgi:hypothetical protein